MGRRRRRRSVRRFTHPDDGLSNGQNVMRPFKGEGMLLQSEPVHAAASHFLRNSSITEDRLDEILNYFVEDNCTDPE
jgi:hypothetical protein